MKEHCRNNVANWLTREVAAPRGAKGFDYYSVKDRAMAEAAEYGLMLWDGKSKGTVNKCREPVPRLQACGRGRRANETVPNRQELRRSQGPSRGG